MHRKKFFCIFENISWVREYLTNLPYFVNCENKFVFIFNFNITVPRKFFLNIYNFFFHHFKCNSIPLEYATFNTYLIPTKTIIKIVEKIKNDILKQMMFIDDFCIFLHILAYFFKFLREYKSGLL